MKKIIFFLLIWVPFLFNAQTENKIDSLIIKASQDPGSGPGFYYIKLFFKRNEFIIQYKFMESVDRKYVRDLEFQKYWEEKEKMEFKNVPRSYFDKFDEIRDRYTTFYTEKIRLKNKKNQEYLTELLTISNISQADIEKDIKKSYIHGVMFSFDFYKKSGRNLLFASALEKDNLEKLYHFLTHTLDLYRKQNKDNEKFNSKTFKY